MSIENIFPVPVVSLIMFYKCTILITHNSVEIYCNSEVNHNLYPIFGHIYKAVVGVCDVQCVGGMLCVGV